MNDADDDAQEKIRRYLDPSVSESDLYALLADSAGLGADDVDRVVEGRGIFSRLWRVHGDAICVNPIVRGYVQNPTTIDSVALCTHMLGVVASIQGINLVLFCSIAVRIGIRTLCASRPGSS